MTMNKTAKRRLQREFFKRLGPNAENFKAMLDCAPQLCFYMKDREGRIMALNRRNCEFCNIKDEMDAVGLKSSDLFPSRYAADFMAADAEVLRKGKPLLGHSTTYALDRSLSVLQRDLYPLFDVHGRIIGTACAYRVVDDKGAAQARYGRVRSTAEHIQNRYASVIRLDELVSMSGMSKTAFKQTFCDVFSMTPGRYITTIRLNAARKLLETTEMPLVEIATETGFFDQSHLTRAFKRERGMTPGEYRRRHKAG